MWTDTETEIDFLDYSEVAELIAELIATPDLLPGSTIARTTASTVNSPRSSTAARAANPIAVSPPRLAHAGPAKIEDFRDRLERRIRTTVHYMDVMGRGPRSEIARLIKSLSDVRADETEIRLRSPDVGLPMTSLALYTPPPPRAPPERTRFKVPKQDRYLRAYVEATTEFDRMVRITDHKLLEFVRRQMQGRDRVSSREIVVESISDLFAYRVLPNLAAVGRSVRLGEFVIRLQ